LCGRGSGIVEGHYLGMLRCAQDDNLYASFFFSF